MALAEEKETTASTAAAAPWILVDVDPSDHFESVAWVRPEDPPPADTSSFLSATVVLGFAPGALFLDLRRSFRTDQALRRQAEVDLPRSSVYVGEARVTTTEELLSRVSRPWLPACALMLSTQALWAVPCERILSMLGAQVMVEVGSPIVSRFAGGSFTARKRLGFGVMDGGAFRLSHTVEIEIDVECEGAAQCALGIARAWQ